MRCRITTCTRSLVYGLLASVTVIGCLVISPVMAEVPGSIASVQASASVQSLVEQGKALYQAGRFLEAIDRLQQALQQTQDDKLQQALIFSNLSLAYQRLGSWTKATEAIAESLKLLQALPAANSGVLAQALNIQGRLLLAQGQTEQAIAVWEQATRLYQQVGDSAGAVQSQINQAQALQALGLYRRSIALLTEMNQSLQHQPDSLMQAIVLRQLGDALLVTGDLAQAQQTLERSLAIAQSLSSVAGAAGADAVAAAYLSLGNLTRTQAATLLSLSNLTPPEAIAQLHASPSASTGGYSSANEIVLRRQQVKMAQTYLQQTDLALDRYQQAVDAAQTDETRIQAQLNQLSLLIATDRGERAAQLAAQIQSRLDALPPSRDWIYDQIDLAVSLLKRQPAPPALAVVDVARRLAIAGQQAAELGDVRAQSYALGSLGGLYEQTQQWQAAQTLTQQALMLSQSVQAIDISYRWQWQLGRLQEAQANAQAAIAAYSEAVKSLQALRSDLIAINRDVQFSFRESVEPVYRQLVDLLLRRNQNTEIPAENLQRAREVIEGLQIAELDNFFREACLDTQFQLDRVVDQATLRSAVFYTIVLPDRIEMILKLPQQGLKHYTTQIPQTTVEATAEALLSELKRPLTSQPLKQLSHQLYEWLLRPAEADLANSQVETIVFVLDGSLRSLPMSALYDGQHYLIETYSVALAPGLQLPNPQPLQSKLRALIAGLSEARDNFPPLSYVETEVKQIQSDVPSRVLLDQNFTRENFEKLLNAATFSVVHIATHGQFSSNAAETFILAWDSPINVNELSDLLQSRGLNTRQPIELLVLSACRTAVGDKRAALGLAGVAVRAGARSTLASLWNVDDESSAALMGEFYRELVKSGSKAEALRHAQRALLANPAYSDPRSWASFVLLGNWL